MNWDWSAFWDVIEKSANAIGIVSFVVSLFTFHAARGAKNAVIEYKNVKRYDAEIEGHIEKLRGLHKTISEGDAYSESILTDLFNELDSVLIQYEQIVKPFSRHIRLLQKTINETYERLDTNPNFNKRNIIIKLNRVIELLGRIKKENKL